MVCWAAAKGTGRNAMRAMVNSRRIRMPQGWRKKSSTESGERQRIVREEMRAAG